MRPNFAWEADEPAIALGENLFGNLAVQLMSAVSRMAGFELCSSCGVPYLPSRQSRAGENHYCPTCGKQAAQRDARGAIASASGRTRLRKREGRAALHGDRSTTV